MGKVTELTRSHMTPEFRLHLVTPKCEFYHSQPHHFPFTDPYWAFYWPGGQALTRFILDSTDVFGRTLDFGCGCGSTSLAILKRDQHATVVSADIDPVAVDVTRINGENNLNETE